MMVMADSLSSRGSRALRRLTSSSTMRETRAGRNLVTICGSNFGSRKSCRMHRRKHVTEEVIKTKSNTEIYISIITAIFQYNTVKILLFSSDNFFFSSPDSQSYPSCVVPMPTFSASTPKLNYPVKKKKK